MDETTQALESLAGCLCEALVAAGGPTVCFCGVVPGEIAVADYACDEDCNGGMAWVRLTLAYPSKQLGAQNTDPGNCNLMFGLDIEMGVLRCIPAGDEQGNPPDSSSLLTASELQWSDMAAMRAAILCCGFGADLLLGAYTPIGPQGGLVGGSFALALMVH